MRYPAAIWRAGPPSKQGYPGLAVNACRGVVCHSMVGSYDAAMGELDNITRRASWHFSVLKSGRVEQHYEVGGNAAVTWHCGSPPWNGKLIGIEHEGGLSPYNEPLTPAQLGASVALVRWLAKEHRFLLERGVGLFEHREVAPPSGSTACPSNRIPWAAYAAAPAPEDDMKPYLAWCPDFLGGSIWFIGPQGARWIKDGAVVDELAREFGPMTKAHKAKVITAIGIVA